MLIEKRNFGHEIKCWRRGKFIFSLCTCSTKIFSKGFHDCITEKPCCKNFSSL